MGWKRSQKYKKLNNMRTDNLIYIITKAITATSSPKYLQDQKLVANKVQVLFRKLVFKTHIINYQTKQKWFQVIKIGRMWSHGTLKCLLYKLNNIKWWAKLGKIITKCKKVLISYKTKYKAFPIWNSWVSLEHTSDKWVTLIKSLEITINSIQTSKTVRI
jgi:hypothetical protein